ncbi:MAG: FGGY-family carbohydrate kinase [Pseudomonadota bacterium]
MKEAVLGIDVGTGSARAGVFDMQGQLLGVGKQDIRMHEGPDGIAEHESADIWTAVGQATRAALSKAGHARVLGIGVDAACSLVIEGQQLSEGGCPARDVIVWMDHRATAEAEEINAGNHAVLAYVGGRISPEMQTPKLLWLARHRPEAFANAPHFMDLADWLTYRLTGLQARSACTLTCKWTYLAHENRWDPDYFHGVGLGALADEAFCRIGTDIRAPGAPIGGLAPDAAGDLGLPEDTPVATGLIDAHAGGVGTLGAPDGPGTAATRMAYVFGTSACTMTSGARPIMVPGVWGPYFNAMLPDLWLNEGGQSAAGAAMDQIVRLHPAYPELSARVPNVLDHLTERALTLGDPSDLVHRAARLTVVPDFNGNRAPLADPQARAIIAGLGMARDEPSLIDLFVAGLIGIGCGLRHIIEAQAECGLETEAIVISGGAGANPVARQLLADASGLPVLVPATDEPVLLGAAMLGAVAGKAVPDLSTAMGQMSALRGQHRPAAGQHREAHDQIYRRYRALQTAA